MKTVAIIQARMGSSRLPGKIFKPVLGKPLLAYVVERVKRARSCDETVIATTTNDSDDIVADWCDTALIACYRGSENDVLARYTEAAKEHAADLVVRITSDCPLIDPHGIDAVTQYRKNHPETPFVTNSPDEGVPRTYPRGMDAEAFSFTHLVEACNEAKDPAEREHVTPFFRRRPERYPIKLIDYPGEVLNARLTVDVDQDFELVRRILETLYPTNPRFTLEDIFHVLKKHPDWAALNLCIAQKKL